MRTCISALVVILLAMIVIISISATPGGTIKLFFLGPFQNIRYFENLVEAAFP